MSTIITTQRICPKCHGDGLLHDGEYVIDDLCEACGGEWTDADDADEADAQVRP